MPQAVQADWNLIQQLYISGTPLDDIVAQTGVKKGTIACRANRANWKGLASRTKQTLQTINQALPNESEINIENTSKTVRSRAARAISEALSVLPTPSSWKEAAKQQSQLEPLVRNARTVLGWDSDAKTSVINIALMQHNVIDQPMAEASNLISTGHVIELDP